MASLLAVGLIGVGMALFTVMLLRAALSDIQPLDRYQILDVISDPSLSRHAVIYRFQAADASHTSTGMWVIDGHAPERGAHERPHGRPAAVWREGVARIGWQGGRPRLIGDQRDVRADAGALDACTAQLCLDPARVTFVPLPR